MSCAGALWAIARLGLHYAQNDHDRARYQRVLAAGARIVAALEERPADDVLEVFRENLAHVSPLAGAEAVVVRGGRILLHRRADNGLWALPGGLAEIGETLADAAARELWEEVGVRGQISRLLAVFDSLRWDMRTKAQLYAVVFEVASEDEPHPTAEATEVGFFGPGELPPLSPSHVRRIPVIVQMLSGELPAPYFDVPVESSQTQPPG